MIMRWVAASGSPCHSETASSFRDGLVIQRRPRHSEAASSSRGGLGELEPAVFQLSSLSLHRLELSAEIDQPDVVGGRAGELFVQLSLAAREPRELPVDSGELLPDLPQPRSGQNGLAGAAVARRTLS